MHVGDLIGREHLHLWERVPELAIVHVATGLRGGFSPGPRRRPRSAALRRS